MNKDCDNQALTQAWYLFFNRKCGEYKMLGIIFNTYIRWEEAGIAEHLTTLLGIL